jgi:nicotinamide phosphoribosyltransferase
MRKNILFSCDSYKYSHSAGGETGCGQYPPKTEGMMSYIEARGGGTRTLFFGLQMFIKDYLMTPITQEDIDEATVFCEAHGEPFNKEGWQYVLDTYAGFMPVVIRAPKEGSVIPISNALVTIECTDPRCFWVASFLETALLRGVWYPTTVATYSYECKQIIKHFLEKNGSPDAIGFKLHDFGARGVSSGDSASIGGCAHLVNSMGSDTVEGIVAANRYYGTSVGMAGFSIPASEHSTITSWGKENEKEAYRNMINTYAGPGKMFACVSDSYNIMDALEIWKELEDELLSKGGTLVIRPDSGDPVSTPVAVVRRLIELFGFTENAKGYKVLPDHIRVIQGDGIKLETIQEILSQLDYWNISSDNIGFGMGGQLLQILNRDTYAFAMKCCALKVNGIWQDVFKEAPGKNSKRGRLTLVDVNGKIETRRADTALEWKDGEIVTPVMETAFQLTRWSVPNDQWKPWMRSQTLDEVRELANK